VPTDPAHAAGPAAPPPAAPSAAPSAAPPPGTWATIREALRGSEQDFTAGPVGRAVLLLAVPMVLEMALESVFAVVDIFFVGRLGATAVATVGLTEALLAAVYALAMGLGMGTTAVVARRYGEKDAPGAAHAAAQAVLLALGLSAVLGVAGALLAPRLLALMGASPAVIAEGTGYARIMLGGEATIVVLFVVNAALRGAGDAATAMRVLWLANAINLVLDPLLIFGLGPFPELGVTGAAIATTTGRSIGALFALTRLVRRGGRLPVARRHFRPDVAVVRQIARLSATGSLQAIIGTASWIGLVAIIARFGSDALAGYTIGIRMVVFALMPSWGLSNAAATMVGQGLGAGLPERAERAVWVACRYNLYFLGVVGLLFVVFTEAIVGVFTADPTVAGHAERCLRIVAAGFLFYAYGMVLAQAFNGAGDTRTPTVLNFAVFWLFEIPLAWLLAEPLGHGPTGVFVAIAVAFSTFAVVSAVVFRRGHWKAVRV
jgi:putative MATE family efflux protein